MVTALACRWDLGASLYRETLDADLGIPPVLARDLDIPAASRQPDTGRSPDTDSRNQSPTSRQD